MEFRWVTIRGRTALQRTRYDERQAFTSNHAIEGEGGLVSKSASGDERRDRGEGGAGGGAEGGI